MDMRGNSPRRVIHNSIAVAAIFLAVQVALCGKRRRFEQPPAAGSRGDNRRPVGDHEAEGGDASCGVVMEAAPVVVAEAELLLELEVIALDRPARLGEIDQPFDRGVGGHGDIREPRRRYDGQSSRTMSPSWVRPWRR